LPFFFKRFLLEGAAEKGQLGRAEEEKTRREILEETLEETDVVKYSVKEYLRITYCENDTTILTCIVCLTNNMVDVCG